MNELHKRRRARIGILTLGLLGLFALVIVRLILLVTFQGPRLNSRARSEHTGALELAAVRGPIVDRNGEPLAMSAETRSIYARPHTLLAKSTLEERAKLADTLGVPAAELEAKLHRREPFVWLERHVEQDRADQIEGLGLDGIGAMSEYKRYYPESNLAAAVVGLAGVDGQGLSGLELQYDALIRGAPLELSFYRDALGHPILDNPLALRNPEPGARLQLTIDSEIQSLAETELGNEIKLANARRGVAIVLDPFTGEFLALANVSAEPAADEADSRARRHDFAVEDVFEPGSTIKGILGSIALETGAINESEKFNCGNGRFELGRRTIHDHGHHGLLDLGEIVEMSSNIGAAKIALRLGSNRYYRGLRNFGLGRKTGIDLPGEAAGLLTPAGSWREVELANHGFGQGIAVTAIQLAAAYAAIANGGLLMRPYVVKAAYDASGNTILEHQPEVVGRATSPSVAHAMNVILRSVVSGPEGTGRRARVEDIAVAGKTGTAQMVNEETGAYYQHRLVASFVGFLPADDPRLVILVVLEDVNEGHFGGLVAAPVFSSIAAGAVRRLDIAAAHPAFDVASIIPAATQAEAASIDEQAPDAPPSPQIGPAAVPNFVGLSLRRAWSLARTRGLKIHVHGAGYVIGQQPQSGARPDGSAVELTLACEVADASGAAIRSTHKVQGHSSIAGLRGPSR